MAIDEKWNSARNTRSTCKARRRSYLGLASRSWRRSWRNVAGRTVMRSMTFEHALTIAQVILSISVESSFFNLFILGLIVTVNLSTLVHFLDIGILLCWIYLFFNPIEILWHDLAFIFIAKLEDKYKKKKFKAVLMFRAYGICFNFQI